MHVCMYTYIYTCTRMLWIYIMLYIYIYMCTSFQIRSRHSHGLLVVSDRDDSAQKKVSLIHIRAGYFWRLDLKLMPTLVQSSQMHAPLAHKWAQRSKLCITITMTGGLRCYIEDEVLILLRPISEACSTSNGLYAQVYWLSPLYYYRSPGGVCNYLKGTFA